MRLTENNYENLRIFSQIDDENKTHRMIIENGIQAVNDYHNFSNGFIRPGACNETQYFSKIQFESPVTYLVTSENPDQGDIVMRILRLITIQNKILSSFSQSCPH